MIDLKAQKGIATIIVIISILIFSVLGLILASMQANIIDTSRTSTRAVQLTFLTDSGIERGKELLYDNPAWRPPEPPGYLREYMQIGILRGHYDIHVIEVKPGEIELRVVSGID